MNKEINYTSGGTRVPNLPQAMQSTSRLHSAKKKNTDTIHIYVGYMYIVCTLYTCEHICLDTMGL